MSKEWSSHQRAGIDHIRAKKSGIIRSRAGGGKTSVIVESMREIYTAVLILAHNKRNQLETERRINFPTGAQSRTFNSLGYGALRHAGGGVFEVDDRREWQRARVGVDARFQGLSYDLTAPIVRQVVSLVEYAKNTMMTETEEQLEEVVRLRGINAVGASADDLVSLARLSLQQALEDKDKISFTDQIWLPVVRGLKTIMVDQAVIDEGQDLSPLQIRLLEGAVRPGGRVTVVGDDKQAIYAWRGAAEGALERVVAKFGAEADILLPISYRLPLAGIELVRRIAPDIEPRPGAPEGAVFWEPAQAVTNAQPGDVVLSRVNAPLLKVCIRFLRDGKRATVAGKDVGKGIEDLIKDSKARAVGDLLAWLRDYEVEERERLIPLDNPSLIEALADRVETARALSEGVRSINDVKERIRKLFHNEDNNAEVMMDQILCSTTHRFKGFEARRVFLLHETYFKPLETIPAGYRDAYPRAKDHLGKEWLPVAKGEEQNIYYVTTSRFMEDLVCCGGPPPGFIAGREDLFERLAKRKELDLLDPQKESTRPEPQKEPKRPHSLKVPEELQAAMDVNPEADFVMSCAEQWEERQYLSEKQLAGLARWGRMGTWR